ncbi:MAG: hypothetical protein RSH78_03930 [Bacilli bacterium]|uniref:hypothetical protein n=1 Tax=Clostridium sp. TaxID=1506 RepID=UPI002FC76646
MFETSVIRKKSSIEYEINVTYTVTDDEGKIVDGQYWVDIIFRFQNLIYEGSLIYDKKLNEILQWCLMHQEKYENKDMHIDRFDELCDLLDVEIKKVCDFIISI